MMITDDSKAIVLICTKVVLDESADISPLTLSGWNAIVGKIVNSKYQCPGNLFGESVDNLSKELDIPANEAERIVRLLNYSSRLDFELERLRSLGIWILTRADKDYPQRFKKRLKKYAPTVVFGAGERALIGQPGVAIVGSRNIDEQAHRFTEIIGNAAAYHGLVVYSGGARGVDITAMKNAVEGRGYSVGILATSLEKALKNSLYREPLQRGDMALIALYGTNIGFNVGTAMGRNKLIYALSDYAVVVSCDLEKGGTWAGATETLKHHWVPVFVRENETVPEGNVALIDQKGAIPLPDPIPVNARKLKEWLDEKKKEWEESIPRKPIVEQKSLFD
ncbi:MAG: DNA-processing protein DprA [Anaerolineaceae bacterium]|nr:DNA-processing protein DprA [Anaerolineaceae bacterium]